MIGFTEKELGDTLTERLLNLARLRQVLDTYRVSAPIHLFGALDPLYSPLYFAAGAEIFDGLSWLRYAYHDGLAVHPEVNTVLHASLDDRATLREAKRCLQNLGALKVLKRSMQRYASTNGDGFREYGSHWAALATTFSTVQAMLESGDR